MNKIIAFLYSTEFISINKYNTSKELNIQSVFHYGHSSNNEGLRWKTKKKRVKQNG